MASQNAYLYEFLWRGRAPGDTEPPAYHVILAMAGTDGFGSPKIDIDPRGALTPEQAAAEGFDIKTIVAGINTGLMADNTTKAATISDLQSQLTAKDADLAAKASTVDQLTKTVTDQKAAADARLAEMAQTIADLQSKLATISAPGVVPDPVPEPAAPQAEPDTPSADTPAPS